MRCRQLWAGAVLATVVAGCGGEVPTSVGGVGTGGARLSVQGSGGAAPFTYGEEETRELRRSLLTSVREDQPIARGRRQQVILRSFVVGADSFHYALAYGERTGPPTHSVLVKNRKPIAMVRYQWVKRGPRWHAEAARFTFWSATGAPVVAGAVEDRGGALREISAVMERVTFAIVARAVRPAEAQLFFEECFAEYMDLASAAAALAVLIGVPDPTALTKLAAITVASMYAKAVFKLNECIDKHLTDSEPHEGDGSGDGAGGGGGGGWGDVDGGGSGDGDDADLISLLKKLIEDCEARSGDDCLYTFS